MTEVINDIWVPIGVECGLSFAEFYSLNPARMERYLPFFREKNKARIDDRSDTGWINGIYISRAIGASFSKKGKYPDSPIKFYDEPVYDDEDIELQTSFEIARFRSFANAFNNAHGELATLEEAQTGDPDTAERP